ncbi:hypothetical protein XELAEV_18003624mg [Xenopus laevis]|nr:hypothetical protein XELAEV_18003624mg [Xenopus laevis]
MIFQGTNNMNLVNNLIRFGEIKLDFINMGIGSKSQVFTPFPNQIVYVPCVYKNGTNPEISTLASFKSSLLRRQLILQSFWRI